MLIVVDGRLSTPSRRDRRSEAALREFGSSRSRREPLDAVSLVLWILPMESGRHKVRRSGDSFARSRTYWV